MTAPVHPLEAIVQSLQEQNTELAHDRNLADREVRRLRKEADLLRTQLLEAREADPKSDAIREVIDYWRVKRHKTKGTKTPAGGKRWNSVRARLGEKFTVADLKLAVDGCDRLPFVGPQGRVAEPAPGTRVQDDLELICRDETTVERFITYAKDAEKPAERHLRLIVGGALPETPAQAVLHALHERGIRFRANGATDFLSSCPSCGGNLSVRVKVAKRGEIVGLDCYGDPPCDRPQVIFALGLAGSDLVRTRVVLNEFPAPMVLPEHLRVALEQLLLRGVRVEEAA